MRNLIALLCFMLVSIAEVRAEPVVRKLMPDASAIGSARMTYMLWDVYDATLYAPEGKWHQNQPFALTLHYLRSLNGEAIADRSVEEMRKQGFSDEVRLAAWYSQMREIFPDVTKGTTLIGFYKPGGQTIFYENEQEIGVIHDPEFGEWFFNIWLSERTSEPKLRRKLLGLS